MMKIHLLDMGRSKYGDCLLLIQGEQKILIDGGHPGDSSSILRQLTKLLGTQPPFKFDLLIVTHCHADHIGCLPDLIKTENIQAVLALVADEKLGWGIDDDESPPDVTALSDNQKTLFYALQEEDRSSLSDEEIEQFLYDASKLEDNYKAMLESLESGGTKVVRYGTHTLEDIQAVEAVGGSVKLKILGPTQEHLKVCAKAIGKSLGRGQDSFLKDIASDAAPEDLVQQYRSLSSQFSRDSSSGFVEDRPGIGAAKNNQSLVVSVQAGEEEDNWKALLAGDMQFAKAEVYGLDETMQTLLNNVNNNGPYDFIKLTHHSSYNGTDDVILSQWNKHTRLFAHTGGWNDPTHPDGSVLRILEAKAKGKSLLFSRTDRNGIITVFKEDGKTLGMEISKGDFNDFSPNEARDQNAPTESFLAPVVAPNSLTSPVQLSSVELEETQNGCVEVTAKIPHAQTKVTVTIDIDPGKKKVKDGLANNNSIVDTTGRFAGLIGLTSWPRLANNISPTPIDSVKTTLQGMGIPIIDVPTSSLTTAESAGLFFRDIIAKTNCKGVVILGGYDVIPAQNLDVLPSNLRQELNARKRIESDADDFMVWSDDLYVDLDNDGFPNLPISRIPDGNDPHLIIQALSAKRFAPKLRFGVRNIARPFAQKVYQDIPGEMNAIEVSETFGPANVKHGAPQGAVYFMLHGSDRDGTRFWGETSDANEFEAMSISNIPVSTPGTIVFTGCCWGALCAETTANRFTTMTSIRSRKPNHSIALTYLQSGALAFIGCTGSHYSPRQEPFNYHGKPMHDAFWKEINRGNSPAQALFNAKMQYKSDLPHGEKKSFSIGIELKTLKQFACLGLGW